jgi:dTDP-4-amino-4,6-dideoxy-D-galactose acyltransferase
MMQQLSAHDERALFYSPLSFLRGLQSRLPQDFLLELAEAVQHGHARCAGSRTRLFVRHLIWDSSFFSCPMYRLDFADWDESIVDPVAAVAQDLSELMSELSSLHGRYYLFSEIPSEDPVMLQAMGHMGARLIETRITYFHDEVQHFAWPERFSVRKATEADLPELRKVAAEARNRFDRYHADPFFSGTLADQYMSTFIEESVKGFADMVLVPMDTQSPPGAFFTARLKPAAACPPGLDLGQIVLVAVAKERRGWHLRLMAEMSHFFRESGVQVAYMATQSTNRAVIRNCEKLGYRYGRSTHVFATYG